LTQNYKQLPDQGQAEPLALGGCMNVAAILPEGDYFKKSKSIQELFAVP